MKRLLSFLALWAIVAGFSAPRACFAQAVLRVGDTVDIRLSGVPPEEISAFSAPQSIDEGGMLNIPYIGKIKVSGLDADKTQQLIESKLKTGKIYTNPTVTINIAPNRFVNVTGEVKSPQRVQFTADLKLSSAIAGASGFNDFADKKHVKLTREGIVQEIDYRKIAKDPSQDIKLLPGDQIFVPQSSGLPSLFGN